MTGPEYSTMSTEESSLKGPRRTQLSQFIVRSALPGPYGFFITRSHWESIAENCTGLSRSSRLPCRGYPKGRQVKVLLT
jgi:hypothetical protein